MANHKRKFSNIELSFFCSQLAMIQASGISVLEGLSMMQEEAEKEEKEIINEILESLESGSPLYESFAKTSLFPSYLLQMVKIGEETGKLDDVFSALAQHYQREDSIKHSVRHALIYPLLMSAMMILVVFVLLVKVMPIFNQVFIQLGSAMTGLAALLVSAGNFLSGSLLLVLLLLAVILLLLFYIGKRMLHRLPYVKDIYEKIAACRFASGMSLALSSGLNPDLSMELVLELNEDPYFAKKLELCKASVSEGMDLSKSLISSGIFSGLYARMASIGNKSGTLDQVMSQIAENYQDEVDTKINQMLSVIEPTLVIVLSLLVGVILLSVMFPLIGIMSSL